MPIVLPCEKCHRILSAPDDILGNPVKCPNCGAIFTAAERPSPAEPQDRFTATIPTTPPNPFSQSLEDSESPPQPSSRRYPGDDEDLEDERPWEQPHRYGPRRDMESHRGSMILTFGILSIVLATIGTVFGGLLMQPIAVGLGITAWVLGHNDRAKIKAGLMDPAGRKSTATGRILGIIGTFLGLAGLLCFVGFLVYFFREF